jgi:hypothetical protein
VNRDFVEMLSALSAAGAEYLVVGAHAMAAHGRPRATGDLDVWVRPTSTNAERVWQALVQFGAPLHPLTLADLRGPDTIFQMGVEPCRIDVLTHVDGLEFEKAWANRITVEVSGVRVPVLGRADLLANKKTVGRPQDLADVAWLESHP